MSAGPLPRNVRASAAEEIVGLVAARPGVHLRELARAQGVSSGTMFARLRALTLRGALETHRDGRFVRYFLASSSAGPQHRVILAALHAPLARQMLGLLMDRPGATQREMAAAFGVTRGAISRHVRKLCAQGVLSRAAAGQGWSYALVDAKLVAELAGDRGLNVPSFGAWSTNEDAGSVPIEASWPPASSLLRS